MRSKPPSRSPGLPVEKNRQEPGPPVSPADGRPTVSCLFSDPSFFQLFFLSFSWKCILDFNNARLCIGSYFSIILNFWLKGHSGSVRNVGVTLTPHRWVSLLPTETLFLAFVGWFPLGLS